MKIKKVRVSGFDKLYDGYKACIQDNRAGFGDGLFTFLNHQMVSIELDEFTAMELFYLKKFASSVHVLSHEYKAFVEKEEAIDLNQKVQGLLEVHDSIIGDEDINKETCNPDNILPMGCRLYDVVAIFKGSKILSITGSMIQNLFKDEQGKFEDMYIGNFPMENRIATMFYNAFYSFISAEMTNIDIITEFTTDKSYYRFADSLVSLAHVNSPFGELTLYGNNQQGLTFQINQIKKSMETSPYRIFDDTYLTFCMRTTFNTFMELYLNTPYIIDHENLKLTFNAEEVLVDDSILEKYNAQISNSLDYLSGYKKELANSSDINLNKFNYIFGGNPITYSVQIPLQDIIDKTYYFGRDDITNHEIKKICNDISKLSQIAMSIFG